MGKSLVFCFLTQWSQYSFKIRLLTCCCIDLFSVYNMNHTCRSVYLCFFAYNAIREVQLKCIRYSIRCIMVCITLIAYVSGPV